MKEIQLITYWRTVYEVQIYSNVDNGCHIGNDTQTSVQGTHESAVASIQSQEMDGRIRQMEGTLELTLITLFFQSLAILSKNRSGTPLFAGTALCEQRSSPDENDPSLPLADRHIFHINAI
jgi:hypothetical protein